MVNGLAAIQSLAARHELRRYVVVGLGTNGPVSAAQIRQLRHLTGPNRDLILVNTFGPMPWESSVNTVLDAAARHTAHVSLADWHAAIAGHTSLLWPDRIHPQPAGRQGLRPDRARRHRGPAAARRGAVVRSAGQRPPVTPGPRPTGAPVAPGLYHRVWRG